MNQLIKLVHFHLKTFPHSRSLPLWSTRFRLGSAPNLSWR